MKLLYTVLLLAVSGVAMAAGKEIPLDELGFVDNVTRLDKAGIVEQLGEPSRVIDLKNEDGEVYASIWHYHYINTSLDGDYYKTTELDFIGDRVVNIVFSAINEEENAAAANLAPDE